MNAYAKTRSRNAPFIVEELLREMDDIFQKTGDRRTKPNSRSFNTCLDAWAKSGQPGAAERILEWIEQMNSVSGIESRNALTNKWTYNVSIIAAWFRDGWNIGLTHIISTGVSPGVVKVR